MWIARDQLVSASDGGAAFSYDAVGRRVSRTVSGLTTPYLYDGRNLAAVAGNMMLNGLGIDENYAQVSGSAVTSALLGELSDIQVFSADEIAWRAA
jgi:YD repeat-containing protein